MKQTSSKLDWIKKKQPNDHKQQTPKPALLTWLINVPVHAPACVYTHNQDEQKRVQSLAAAPASLARSPQCHVPPARACPMARQCQPRQSNVIQMCKPARYQSAL